MGRQCYQRSFRIIWNNMATAKVVYKSSTSKTPTLRFPNCSLLFLPTFFSPSPQFRLSLTASTIAWVPLRRIYGRRSLLLCQRVARSPHHCHQNGWRAQAWQSCHHHHHPYPQCSSSRYDSFHQLDNVTRKCVRVKRSPTSIQRESLEIVRNLPPINRQWRSRK